MDVCTYTQCVTLRRYRFVGKMDVCYDSKSTIDKSEAIVCRVVCRFVRVHSHFLCYGSF